MREGNKEIIMSNQLYEDIPSLKNKAIIDLVNIVSNNKDIIAEREDRGFLGGRKYG